jgi:small GTP-binding protein
LSDREKKIEALLDWYFQDLGENIIAAVVADRQGLLLGSKGSNKKIDAETLGGLSALVEPVLKRISGEFKSSGFGAGTFDTEQYRFIFIEAGELAICITVIDLYSSLDEVFPYAYIMAEKLARILDGRPVSPVIPELFKSKLNATIKKNEIQKIELSGTFVYKLILGGDGGVGKTSLVHTFVDGVFNTDYKATIGTSIMKKEITSFPLADKGTLVRLMIWDLAGQGQFARVRQTYLQDSRCGFIVYDVTRPETFQSVERWYNEFIKGAGESIMIMLIGNKIDLESERKVTKAQGEELAKKLKIPYFETSAKNKDLVDEAFGILAFRLIQDKLVIKQNK